MRRFLVDNQLPAALVHWIESKDCRAEHVLALDMAQSRDEIIWEWARQSRAVIVSQDEDFAQMTVMRPEQVQVVWLRLGNCRTTVLLAVMERAWADITIQLDAGARLIEVR